MKNLRLSSILIFALVISFIMTYRLSPGETPYWLFGLIFLGLVFYLVLDLLKLSQKLCLILKQLTLWFIIIAVLGSAFVSAIIVRYQTAPTYLIHDIVLQQESAIQFLLSGKNPYAATYFGTPLEQWHYSDKEINPALYHFVMEPFYLLFALPFYFVSISFLGFFDGRIPLLFLFTFLLILAVILVKDKEKRLIFLTLLAFNPAMLGYTLEGRSDIFMYAFLFFSFFLLYKKKYVLAGIPLGLAFATKQSAWPILPFYLFFLYFNLKNFKEITRAIFLFIITFGVISVPFFLWDKKAFLESTVFYLSGTASHSYPISGYGLGALLGQLGGIGDKFAYYPFWIWQMVFGLPLMVILFRWQKSQNTVPRLILAYGIFLFVFWYLSRYFNNSHLGYLSMVFITAYFWPE